ncbi:SOSS complex subunit C homolog [Littorina saxatilis]|uniref:SOSS complex subunit C n=1 Tax=Littorina saxatilis TaxID=31220 RepID=A0AAN9B930_9CAEN
MAYNVPQESRNRKLLEQLEEQKKRLRGHIPPIPPGAASATPSTSNVASSSSGIPPITAPPAASVPPPVATISTLPPDAAGMTSQQRTALQYAHANSFGYFITQDSSFGNLILPVLPRYAEK